MKIADWLISNKGFCQVKKKFKNPRKTRKWVGESSPNSDLIFFLNFCVFVLYFIVVHVTKKCFLIGFRGGWVGSGQAEFFSDFLIFFNLTKPQSYGSFRTVLYRRTDNIVRDTDPLYHEQPLCNHNDESEYRQLLWMSPTTVSRTRWLIRKRVARSCH